MLRRTKSQVFCSYNGNIAWYTTCVSLVEILEVHSGPTLFNQLMKFGSSLCLSIVQIEAVRLREAEFPIQVQISGTKKYTGVIYFYP